MAWLYILHHLFFSQGAVFYNGESPFFFSFPDLLAVVYQEMDRARRAHAEKLERDQAERAKERQDAEAKSRSREALFNTPFAGLGGLLWDEVEWMGGWMCQEVVREEFFCVFGKNMWWGLFEKR